MRLFLKLILYIFSAQVSKETISRDNSGETCFVAYIKMFSRRSSLSYPNETGYNNNNNMRKLKEREPISNLSFYEVIIYILNTRGIC